MKRYRVSKEAENDLDAIFFLSTRFGAPSLATRIMFGSGPFQFHPKPAPLRSQ
jgi:hypothetical protein